MKNKPPTDLEILEEIYRSYYPEFISFSKEEPNRAAKIAVPIDIEAVAKHFSIDPDIIFGRLYYHLNKKYGYEQSDGSKVHFFMLQAGSDKHAVQFPLLASVMADLRDERSKHLTSTWLSITAIAISVVSLILSLLLGG